MRDGGLGAAASWAAVCTRLFIFSFSFYSPVVEVADLGRGR